MNRKAPPERAAGQLATDPARGNSGDPKLAEPAKAGNFERDVEEILSCYALRHRAVLDNIEISPVVCPRCRLRLITGRLKGLPQTLHACRCIMIGHLTPGDSIPRNSRDWSRHLLAQAADYAKEEAGHECS